MMPKITQKMLTEKMVPIASMDKEIHEKLKVVVDGHNADCYIDERWGSSKIVILFENEHPKWGKSFTTKYFTFEKPGIMSWGYKQEHMHIAIV